MFTASFGGWAHIKSTLTKHSDIEYTCINCCMADVLNHFSSLAEHCILCPRLPNFTPGPAPVSQYSPSYLQSSAVWPSVCIHEIMRCFSFCSWHLIWPLPSQSRYFFYHSYQYFSTMLNRRDDSEYSCLVINLGGKTFISPLAGMWNCGVFVSVLEYIEDHVWFFFLIHLVILCLLVEECGHSLSTTVTTKYMLQKYLFLK